MDSAIGIDHSPDGRSSAASLLPLELVEALKRIGRVRAFARNTIVVHEGDPAETLYLILEGRLRVFVANEDGDEAELNVLGPGEYFGELMLDSPRRSASVGTLTPVRLCAIDRGDFERLLATEPAVASHLIHSLMRRVRVLTRTVSGLALLDVYGRLTALLAEAAVERDGMRVVTQTSQQQLAERVGASRSMVNRILKDLAEGGYVLVTRREIVIRRELPKRW